MKTKVIILLFIALFCATNALYSQTTSSTSTCKCTAADAGQHIGEKCQVTGVVVSSYQSEREGSPLFLSIDNDYPKEKLQVVIFPNALSLFPEDIAVLYTNTKVNIVGTITVYKKHPQIIVSKPEQISIAE